MLAAIRQKLLNKDKLAKLETMLRNRLKQKALTSKKAKQLAAVQKQVADVEAQLKTVERNLAFAETEDQFRSMSMVQKQLKVNRDELVAKLVSLRASHVPQDAEGAVATAMERLGALGGLATDEEDLPAITGLFKNLNAQLYVRFHVVRKRKRTENKLRSGIVTFGNAPSPIQKYTGPTGRRALMALADGRTTNESISSEGRDESLGNVSRENKTSFELFLGPFSTWKQAHWQLAGSCNP